ncbi:hypothetical protein MFIFM68171_02482 [Madurella fahalii]|uniref:HNH nuclease domain-containing protein n=1 Tax=Madurella fahalii TaxID=1157608 RepID=A0ABQ0G3G1_9PEZI
MDVPLDRASPSQPSSLHRHKPSLEGIIDLSSTVPLGPDQRAHARRKFYHIVQHFELEAMGTGDNRQITSNSRGNQYNRPLLVRLTYEQARSEESQDVFLCTFFCSVTLSLDVDHLARDRDVEFEDKAIEADLRSALFGFAEYLIDNFFLPLKASTKKTPQPSPAYHSAVLRAQGAALPQGLVRTPERLSALWANCLIRDRHRCMITRKFDLGEAVRRFETHGDVAEDDDKQLLKDDTNLTDSLEVAHILPHSLIKPGPDSQLSSSREAALAILNMFDMGVAHLIEGVEIDRPGTRSL